MSVYVKCSRFMKIRPICCAGPLILPWVGANRPACGVEMTYGRALGKALSYANLDGGKWDEIAQDRSTWAAMIKNLC